MRECTQSSRRDPTHSAAARPVPPLGRCRERPSLVHARRVARARTPRCRGPCRSWRTTVPSTRAPRLRLGSCGGGGGGGGSPHSLLPACRAAARGVLWALRSPRPPTRCLGYGVVALHRVEHVIRRRRGVALLHRGSCGATSRTVCSGARVSRVAAARARAGCVLPAAPCVRRATDPAPWGCGGREPPPTTPPPRRRPLAAVVASPSPPFSARRRPRARAARATAGPRGFTTPSAARGAARRIAAVRAGGWRAGF